MVEWILFRNELSNHRCTTVSQHLPEDLINLQNEFLSLILFKRRQYNYDIHHIGNMDEMPLSFDLLYPVTLDKCGAKPIGIRITEHERTSFTVILGCLANGRKLPPVCIFKLKNIPRENFPEGVIIRVNAKEWCNEEEMKYWINNVWSELGLRPKPFFLVTAFLPSLGLGFGISS